MFLRKSIIGILSLSMIMSTTFIACSNRQENINISEGEIQSLNIEKTVENKYEAEISEFEFGDYTYTSSWGRTMPYNIRGRIAVPKGEGKFPVVFITHGSHENIDESKRFDTGFDYLIKSLAENGYVAVSMDMSKAYIWKYGDNDDTEKSIPMAEKHIEMLKNANEGKNPGYSIDLTNKINFDDLCLAGHSRGGLAVIEIANNEIRKGNNVKGVLLIAPTLNEDIKVGEYDISIIVPQYDGDVASLEGYGIYDSLKKEDRNYLASVTLLERANHNYFNRNIVRNDAEFVMDKYSKEQLTREEQEDFLQNFAVDFFNTSLSKNLKNTMYDLEQPQPNKMYGYDVKVETISGKVTQLVDMKNIENVSSEGSVIEATVDSWFFKDDKTLIDTLTFGNGELKIKPLLNVKWTSENDTVTIKPKTSDFTSSKSIIINLAVDSADELNEKNKSQSFTVQLKDKKQKISNISLPEGINALKYYDGEIGVTPLDNEEIKYWTTKIPLGEVRIPLKDFQNIDLSNIDEVSFLFNKTLSGGILIESIQLQ